MSDTCLYFPCLNVNLILVTLEHHRHPKYQARLKNALSDPVNGPQKSVALSCQDLSPRAALLACRPGKQITLNPNQDVTIEVMAGKHPARDAVTRP